MSARHTPNTAWRDGIVERLAEKGWSDLRLRFGTRSQIADAEAGRRILPGEAGANGLRSCFVTIEGNRRSLGEGLWAASGLMLGVHRLLEVAFRCDLARALGNVATLSEYRIGPGR